MKLKRTFISLSTALAVVLLTTGCIKLNMDLTVEKDDTVSGTIVFAIAKSLSELAQNEGSGESSAPTTDGLLKNAKDVKIAKFDDGDFVGSSYTFENLPLEEMAPEVGDNSNFAIARDGDNLIVSGAMDFSSGDSTESNPFADAMMAGFAASTDIRISVSLPGEIKDTNGTVEGQKITWKGKFGKSLELKAVSYSPLTPPINWLLVGGISVVLISAAILGFWQFRKSRSTSPDRSLA